MIRNKVSKLILLGYILFMVALNVSPMILRALEYKTSEPVPKNSEQQPLEEPATMTHMCSLQPINDLGLYYRVL
jgi:predicted cobalt transporter CbtA